MELAQAQVVMLLKPPPALRTVTVKVYRELQETPSKKVVLMVYPGIFDTLNPASVFVSGETEVQTFTAEAADREWLFIATDLEPPKLTGAVYEEVSGDRTVVLNLQRPFDPTILQGDGYLAGEYPDGITTVEGVPVPATVRVLLRGTPGRPEDGMVVATTESSPAGTWAVYGLNADLRFDVVARHDDFNDVIGSNIQPYQGYVELALSGDLTPNAANTELSGTVVIQGGTAPFTMEVTAGATPPGISLNLSSRNITASGFSMETGTFEWTLTVTDALSETATKVFSVAMKSPASALFDGLIKGSLLDLNNGATLWQDDAGTVPAGVGDRVALITDTSGNGCHAYQTNASLRPYLRADGGGKKYLEADSTVWMYLGAAAADTDLPVLALAVAQRAGSISPSTVLVDKPHAATHVSPYFRWSLWRTGGSTIECRINGTPYYSNAGWDTNDQTLFVDTGAGLLSAGPGSTTFPPQAVEYPNAVQARVFSNASGNERFVGRLYALVLVGRSLTSTERDRLRTWLTSRMP